MWGSHFIIKKRSGKRIPIIAYADHVVCCPAAKIITAKPLLLNFYSMRVLPILPNNSSDMHGYLLLENYGISHVLPY